MCGIFGGSSSPPPMPKQKPAAERPTPPEPPTQNDPAVGQARKDERRRLRALAGRSSTVATSASGLSSEANTGKKKLGA